LELDSLRALGYLLARNWLYLIRLLAGGLSSMKKWILFGSGLAAGVAFALSCDRASNRAQASPADCATWQWSTLPPGEFEQVQYRDSHGAMQTLTAYDVPSGWEPFAPASGAMVIRRCKP
jgi:hypothetical protein